MVENLKLRRLASCAPLGAGALVWLWGAVGGAGPPPLCGGVLHESNHISLLHMSSRMLTVCSLQKKHQNHLTISYIYMCGLMLCIYVCAHRQGLTRGTRCTGRSGRWHRDGGDGKCGKGGKETGERNSGLWDILGFMARGPCRTRQCYNAPPGVLERL